MGHQRRSLRQIVPVEDEWSRWVVKRKLKQDKLAEKRRNEMEYLEYSRRRREEKMGQMEMYRRETQGTPETRFRTYLQKMQQS